MTYKDPERVKQYKREWHQKNRNYQRYRKRTRVQERVACLQKYKIDHGCLLCGEKHPACLDFHHRDPTEKDFALAQFVTRHCTWKRVEDEIAKCDILCSNCHRKLHWDERKIADESGSIAALVPAT